MADKVIENTKKTKKTTPVEPSNQAKVYLKSIRVSPIKLNLVVSPIRGLEVEKAISYLSFSNKRIAIQIKKALQSAIANAENNHQLDVDKLFVSEASVGKGMVMKRFRARARGRGSKIFKPFSNLTIKLKEKEIENKSSDNNVKKQSKSSESKLNDSNTKEKEKDVKHGTKS